MTTELAARDPELLARLMTEDEAREAVAGIKRSIGSLRAKLVELHEREGWRALGYASIEACCAEEFGWKRSHLFRQLTAGAIERNLQSPLGTERESHLRPLAGKPPEVQRQAWAEANTDGAPTAEKVRQAVERIDAEKEQEADARDRADEGTRPADVQARFQDAGGEEADPESAANRTSAGDGGPAVTQSEPEHVEPDCAPMSAAQMADRRRAIERFDQPDQRMQGSVPISENRRLDMLNQVDSLFDLGEIEAAVLKRHGISVGKAAGYFAQILAAAEQGGATWEKRLKVACRKGFQK